MNTKPDSIVQRCSCSSKIVDRIWAKAGSAEVDPMVHVMVASTAGNLLLCDLIMITEGDRLTRHALVPVKICEMPEVAIELPNGCKKTVDQT